MSSISPSRRFPRPGLWCPVAVVAATTVCAAVPASRPKPFDAPLGRPPLTPPLVVTGGFGEYRIGHFHAAFDFGTGGKVGQPVFAPLAGHVERIRGSGVGYGRSIYLRTRDGRLLQFGHLDAFAEPMASWVRAVQDSSGVYEQDLWPEPARFPIKQGQQIAWTGESGAGGPHMHFEIRRGDMAYHPQLAGLTIQDDRAPSLVSLTLEPLDDTSYVAGSAAPVTRRFGARAETLAVYGRVRAVVGARDGTWSGVDRMMPWLTRMEWGADRIECRMDSISWATDMSEGDEVYDAGRVTGEKGLVLWAAGGFRPRFIRTSVPRAEDAGVIQVRAGDRPRPLRLMVEDASGNVGRRTVIVRSGRGGPDTTRTLVLKSPRKGDDRFEFAALPHGYVRVTYRGGGAGARGVRVRWAGTPIERAATPGTEGWSAVLPSVGDQWAGALEVSGRLATGAIATDVLRGLVVMRRETRDRAGPLPLEWSLPHAARFDSCAYLVMTEGGMPAADRELSNGAELVQFAPATEPLRGPIKLELPATESPRAGVYRYDDDGWSWVGNKREGNRYQLESRRLGWFAEFQDTTAPRITLREAPKRPAPGPYNRWAVEATVSERGSGVDSRASYFVVDDTRVAAEWDPEADVLRWRPLAPPPPGTHRYEVVVGDRAGNLRRVTGTFVLD